MQNKPKFNIDVVVECNNINLDVLLLQLQAIQKFMPWVRTIHVLAKSIKQSKKAIKKFKNVKVVEVDSMHEASMLLHTIKSLANHFIKLDENDMPTFFSDYRSWFSEDGIPKVPFKWKQKYDILKTAHLLDEQQMFNSIELCNKICKKQYYATMYFKPLPTALPMTKVIIKEVWSKVKKQLNSSLNAFSDILFWQYAQQNSICISNDNDFNVFQFFHEFKLLKEKSSKTTQLSKYFFVKLSNVVDKVEFVQLFKAHLANVEALKTKPKYNVDYDFDKKFSKQFKDGVDVLYVVGPSNRLDNFALRASLRSLQKYAKNVNRVIVAGYPPEWLSDNVIKVPCADAIIDGVTGKHWNILNCIKTAIEKCKLEKPFLYSSDDHFFLKEVDLKMFPRFNRALVLPSFHDLMRVNGTTNSSDVHLWGIYKDMLARTRKMLVKHFLPTRMACCHNNTWIDPKYVDDVVKLAYEEKDLCRDYGFEPTCMFNAFFEKDNPNAYYQNIVNNDKKVIQITDFEITTKIDGIIQFSINEVLDNSKQLAQKLLKLYCKESQYEKHGSLDKKLYVDDKHTHIPTVAIACMFFGSNINLFNEFYISFKKHFCIDCYKKFIVLTDTPKIASNLSDCIIYNISNMPESKEFIKIRKFKYLMYAEDQYSKFDYSCFIDSRLVCKKDIKLEDVIGEKQIAVVSSKNKKIKSQKWFVSKYSIASFMPKADFNYCISDLILAKSEMFLMMCNQLESWRCFDMLTNASDIINGHDDAYYNRFIYEAQKYIKFLPVKEWCCLSTQKVASTANIVLKVN